MDRNLQKLRKLLDFMDEDTLTREEFKKAFEIVIDFVKRAEQRQLALLKQSQEATEVGVSVLKKTLTKGQSELNGVLDQAIKDFEKEIEKRAEQAKSRNQKRVENELDQLLAVLKSEAAKLAQQKQEVDRRLSLIRDGKDADERKIVDEVVERIKEEIPTPTSEDILNDIPAFGAKVRDSLELLQGEDRLKAEAISGLEELVKDFIDLQGTVKRMQAVASSPAVSHWQRNESFAVTGATTSVSLQQAPGQGGAACIVWYQGQALEPGNHYTVDGLNINFSGVTFISGTTVTVSYWP